MIAVLKYRVIRRLCNYGIFNRKTNTGLMSAKHETDLAALPNGQGLTQKKLESEIIRISSVLREDCKVMSSIQKILITSRMQVVPLRRDHDNYKFISVAEGGQSIDINQELVRKDKNHHQSVN